MFIIKEPWLILLIILFSSFFISISWPAIRAAFADYVSESHKYEKEIEGLMDFSINVGFIIGPALAGVTAGIVGNSEAFALMGVAGIFITIYLVKITPKNIKVVIHRKIN